MVLKKERIKGGLFFNILETVNTYNDTWKVTFYYILVLIILIAIFWTYIQVFVKPLNKKKNLKENVIYQHSEDIIENYTNENYQKRNKTIKK